MKPGGPIVLSDRRGSIRDQCLLGRTSTRGRQMLIYGASGDMYGAYAAPNAARSCAVASRIAARVALVSLSALSSMKSWIVPS